MWLQPTSWEPLHFHIITVLLELRLCTCLFFFFFCCNSVFLWCFMNSAWLFWIFQLSVDYLYSESIFQQCASVPSWRATCQHVKFHAVFFSLFWFKSTLPDYYCFFLPQVTAHSDVNCKGFWTPWLNFALLQMQPPISKSLWVSFVRRRQMQPVKCAFVRVFEMRFLCLNMAFIRMTSSFK